MRTRGVIIGLARALHGFGELEAVVAGRKGWKGHVAGRVTEGSDGVLQEWDTLLLHVGI